MLCLRPIAPSLFTLRPPDPAHKDSRWPLPQFTLAALFLGMTLAAVWLALTQLSLIYALLVLAIVGPAIARTAVVLRIGQRSGRPLSGTQTTLVFVASVGAVLLPMLLLLPCLMSGPGMIAALFLGLAWAIWPAFRHLRN